MRGAWLLGALGAACTPGTPEVPMSAPMSGYLEADLVYVAPRQAGVLQAVAVQRGERVARGQLLYALEDDSEVFGRESAAARSDAALAQEQDLRKGRRTLELQSLDAQLAQARATLAEAGSALDRQRRLVEQGYIAPIRLEELAAAHQRAAAHLSDVQAQRRLAAEPARSDTIAAAAAQSRAAAAELALARWREAQASRAAPVDAEVYDVLYRGGEWVAAGAPVVALQPAGALKLRFFVPEPALAQVQVGGEVALACDGCPAGLAARVSWVSPRAEYTPPLIYSNSSRAKLVFMAEAEPLAAAARLKAGQPVDVRLK